MVRCPTRVSLEDMKVAAFAHSSFLYMVEVEGTVNGLKRYCL